METTEKLLEIKNLKQYFNIGKPNEVKAVDNVSFDIFKGETLGLVGESGCGKSTTGRTIIRLYDATDGEVLFNGVNVHGKKSRSQLKEFNRKMQMIFQDPQASLNPRMKVSDIIAEGIDIHGLAKTKKERMDRVIELLETVGLNKEHANRYPHEFSGGQRQRIGIARALAVEPEFIIADEPISALDVSIQAQILNLLLDLQEEYNLTYLFIGHNLSVIKFFCHRVAVLYKGHIVEVANSQQLYSKPYHPISHMLLQSVLSLEKHEDSYEYEEIVSADGPKLQSGCVFSDKCSYATATCLQSHPSTISENDGGNERAYACYHPLNQEIDQLSVVSQ